MKKIKNILKLYPNNIWFISLAVLIPSLYSLFNRYFIGYMGMESIVVEQSYESLEVLMEIFLEMLPLSLLAIVAQNFKNKDEIRDVVKNTALIQLILTLTFTVISCVFAKNFIDFINTPESSKEIALSYFRLKSLVLPIQSLSLIFILAIKSATNAKKAILISFFTVLTNFIFDALLISNYSFSLRLGLKGSALSSILSNLATLILAFIVFKKEIGLNKNFFKLELDKKIVKRVLNIGKYNGLESLIRNVGYIIGVVALVNTISSEIDIVAYNTIGSLFWSIILIPVLAISEGTQIAIGNAYGEQRYEDIKNILKISFLILSIWFLIWILGKNILVEPIVKWLNGDIKDTNVINSSLKTFNILIFAYFAFMATSLCNAYFIGLGKPKSILITSLIINCVIYIPLGLLCKYQLINITYTQMLNITLIIYILNYLIMWISCKKHYLNLIIKDKA